MCCHLCHGLRGRRVSNLSRGYMQQCRHRGARVRTSERGRHPNVRLSPRITCAGTCAKGSVLNLNRGYTPMLQNKHKTQHNMDDLLEAAHMHVALLHNNKMMENTPPPPARAQVPLSTAHATMVVHYPCPPPATPQPPPPRVPPRSPLTCTRPRPVSGHLCECGETPAQHKHSTAHNQQQTT